MTYVQSIFKGSLFTLVFLFLAFTASLAAEATSTSKTTPLIISKADGTLIPFETELALTNKQRGLGLMYRTELAPNRGMLFIFRQEQQMNFWMRNVEIPLDIIFLNADGSIINISAMAEPHTDTQRQSKGPAKAVFEIYGGRAAELGLAPGDIVHHALLGNMIASTPSAP